MKRKKYKCPNCADGYLKKTRKVEECTHCNTFALVPVEGKEPPLRFALRSLHEVGCEPGLAEHNS